MVFDANYRGEWGNIGTSAQLPQIDTHAHRHTHTNMCTFYMCIVDIHRDTHVDVITHAQIHTNN